LIPTEVLIEILSGYELRIMGIHGIAHWGRVLENGSRLAAKTGADTKVITLFAVFHDARRIREGTDPDHGKRGAELASRLRSSLDLTDPQFERLEHACIHHADGKTEGDPTVQTCWDADRLDLWRVGITPRAPMLCTEAARDPDLREWTRTRSIHGHLPDCSSEWLRALSKRPVPARVTLQVKRLLHRFRNQVRPTGPKSDA